MPATPPPMTRQPGVTPTVSLVSGSWRRDLATAILTMSIAFFVAASFCPLWHQEHCSRMSARSKRYLFRPASRIVSWKSGSWVRGVQEATTMRLRFWSLMICFIDSWLSWAQA